MFYHREKEQKQIMSILNSEPGAIQIIYGPINSGKTNLITNVLGNLPKQMIPFYTNLRGFDIRSIDDFLNIFFDIDTKSKFENSREYLKEICKGGLDALKEFQEIPVPTKIFDLMFKSQDKGSDVFKYLESFFRILVKEKKLQPVFIVDELQMMKDIVNSKGNPLIDRFFNFLVRLTKETHLCHCIVMSSDSLFIEQIYGRARLEGRCRYILVDDLKKDEAFNIYDKFNLTENKELIWETIGGKIGDIALLSLDVKIEDSLEESLSKMLSGQTLRLEMIDARLYEKDENECKEKMDFLFQVGEKGHINFKPKHMKRQLQFWVEENVLFLDPVKKIIKPQSQLINRGIKELMKS